MPDKRASTLAVTFFRCNKSFHPINFSIRSLVIYIFSLVVFFLQDKLYFLYHVIKIFLYQIVQSCSVCPSVLFRHLPCAQAFLYFYGIDPSVHKMFVNSSQSNRMDRETTEWRIFSISAQFHIGENCIRMNIVEWNYFWAHL